jgi:formylmethanofuran dehydrogenase subunit E
MTEHMSLPTDLQQAVAFHGHLCPGLVLGYRAALAASQALQVGASDDEELILIAENDSCAVDAFQALLSTTFGKGNLLFADHGKQVFTLGDRSSGRAIRVAARYEALDGAETAREEKIARLLRLPQADLFHVNHVQLALPEPARIRDTVRCARCGEGAMSTRTVASEGKSLCLPCARDLGLTE